MNNYTFTSILMVLLTVSLIWATNSLAALETGQTIDVEGLTLEEAEKKYGVSSGKEHPVIFEVNAESGSKECGFILASGGLQACPVAKIFYQSEKVTHNYNGTRTMKVDIYYDVNEVVMKES